MIARLFCLFAALSLLHETARAEESFITIQKVEGNRISFTKASDGAGRGRGRGMQGGAPQNDPAQAGTGRGRRGGGGFGRGQGAGGGRGFGGGRFGGGFRRRGASDAQAAMVTIPTTAKITSAMRERRTFEFRVGIELAGGMRHSVFTEMKKPLSARIVTKGNVVTELNVITEDTDINQQNTSSDGQMVIAVKPKRPPSK